LTTTAADGRVTTFRITPDTAAITQPGTSTPFGPTSFAPTQNVVVVGIVRDGVPVATAIADPAAAGPAGAPIDDQLRGCEAAPSSLQISQQYCYFCDVR
jgi:hypothetical protein